MTYPPLMDPDADEPESSLDNMGRKNRRGQKGQKPQDAPADPPGNAPAEDSQSVRAEDAPDAGPQPSVEDPGAGDDVLAGLEDLDEADLAELNEQVDLGDLGEFAEIVDLADLDALDDPLDPDDIEELDDVLVLDVSVPDSPAPAHSAPDSPVPGTPAPDGAFDNAPGIGSGATVTPATSAAPTPAGLPVPATIQAAHARAVVDEPIPMLTEVVQVPRYDTEDLPESFAEVDWGDLAQRVRENVLERLLRRSDALLDTQLQHTLAPVLERAAETVAHELHDALNRMIRDIVARAVTEELTRLHAEIAKQHRASRSSR